MIPCCQFDHWHLSICPPFHCLISCCCSIACCTSHRLHVDVWPSHQIIIILPINRSISLLVTDLLVFCCMWIYHIKYAIICLLLTSRSNVVNTIINVVTFNHAIVWFSNSKCHLSWFDHQMPPIVAYPSLIIKHRLLNNDRWNYLFNMVIIVRPDHFYFMPLISHKLHFF